jgi:hypothetical protein
MEKSKTAHVTYKDGNSEIVTVIISDKTDERETWIEIRIHDELIDIFQEFGLTKQDSLLYFLFPNKIAKELLYDPSYCMNVNSHSDFETSLIIAPRSLLNTMKQQTKTAAGIH